MMLLAPWALWFLGIAGGVVALYLLKIRRRQAVVPALDFWLALAGRTKAHSLWERLKRLLSMLLWVAIVTCLVLALGNPLLSLGKARPRAIAVVLDNSASMLTDESIGDAPEAVGGASKEESRPGARASGNHDQKARTRFQLAKDALRSLTTRRPVSDQWLLIESGREPRVVRSWTLDAKSVRAAADTLEPFAGSADLDASVALAGQLLEGKPDPCIVVISDGAAGRVASLAAKDARIVHWPVGETSDNLGIARLAVRPHRQQGNYHVLLSIVNASDRQIETRAVFELNGSAYSVELVSVEPHGSWEKSVVLEPPEGFSGGVLRVSIDRPDALLQDNEAFAALQPIRPAVVWLVSKPESAFFFEQALASMDTLVLPEESLTIAPEQYERALAAIASAPRGAGGQGVPGTPRGDGDVDGGPAGDEAGARNEAPLLPRPDLIVFNGWSPRALPKSGRFILVNTIGDLPATVRVQLEAPRLFIPPKPHPVTQHVTFQGARLAGARRVSFEATPTVLAHSEEGDPLIALVDQPDRRTLLLAFDVLESDLPFRNAFPLLLRNAVAYLHDEGPSLVRPEYTIGDTIRPLRALPGDVRGVTAVRAGGEGSAESALPVSDGSFTYAETSRAGGVRFDVGDESFLTAINLADADESRIGVAVPERDPGKALMLSGRLLGTLPWIGLVFLAAVFIALEWMTYHYRWTE